jgi:beta-glucosidase
MFHKAFINYIIMANIHISAKFINLIFSLLLFQSLYSQSKTFEQRADSVIKLMTLDEKIGQLNLLSSDWAVTGPSIRNDYLELIRQGKLGGIFNAYTVDYVRKLQDIAVKETRLHIPLLFGYDVIHGHRTIFPIPLAQASSWDLDAIKQSERIAATEATAEGINWVYAPMVDIARDPRWGRVMEGAGEDTWLGCNIAEARVKGSQGDNIFKANNTLLACVKHFAAYGAPQAGRDYNTVDMSDRSLYEWYLPPYKAVVDAGVASVMTSFNEIGGIPSTANKWLLTDLLRKQWNFKGFVVTDYTAINELINHGVAADSAQAGEISLNAGVDMDLQGSIFLTQLPQLVKNGKISEKQIDAAVRNILVAKFKLGLFDDPYMFCNKKREATEIMTTANLDFARKFVAKSCVLLKNKNQTLPLKKDVKSIAVIGPLADSKIDMLGSWSGAGQWEKCVTLLEGLKNKVNTTTKLNYAKGCNVNDNDESKINEAVALASQSDVVILALGENRDMTGEAASRADISLPGVQEKLAAQIIKTGKPVVVVLFNGRPLTLTLLDNIAPAILETWFGGTQAGNGIADVLFGDYNPSAKITMTFPRSTGQIPIFYNSKNTGRPVEPENPQQKYKSRYLDITNEPLYPFGYGLSYTSFKYSEIKLNKTSFNSNDKIIASINISNTGTYDGEEVVQLYVRDLVGEVTRPVKELKGFQKLMIRKGETKTVTFSLTPKELSYYHINMTYDWDPGTFELFIGTSSADTKSVKFGIEK